MVKKMKSKLSTIPLVKLAKSVSDKFVKKLRGYRGHGNGKVRLAGGGNPLAGSLFTNIQYVAWADKILAWYRRYQRWLWAGAIACLVIALAAIGFNYYQGKASEKASDEFYRLLMTNLPQNNNGKTTNPDNLAALVDFAKNHDRGAGSGYGALAAAMALQLLEKNPNSDLQKKLDGAMARNPQLKNFVALRAADEKTLRTMAVSAASGGGQNLAFINLALADRLTANGKKDEAKKILQTLALDNQNNALGLLVIQFLPAY